MKLMQNARREFMTMAGAATVALPFPQKEKPTMYGLIGKMMAVSGQRDALIAILLEGVSGMPGCLSYVIAKDPKDANALWITEVWDSEQSHRASLSLPSVKDAIKRGKPLIASFGEMTTTTPVGGHGLVPASSK
jgi:quinol monooxygenase YgiN